MKFLQGKSLYVRKRIAIIATGSIGIILLVVFIYIYTHPHAPKHDPERAIDTGYTIIIHKVQSLFHRK
jgi:hypothetical protein